MENWWPSVDLDEVVVHPPGRSGCLSTGMRVRLDEVGDLYPDGVDVQSVSTTANMAFGRRRAKYILEDAELRLLCNAQSAMTCFCVDNLRPVLPDESRRRVVLRYDLLTLFICYIVLCSVNIVCNIMLHSVNI